jgi:GT2 family glycosyltransferase
MSPGADLPSVSVVVPTHGRPRELLRCLHALARLDYPRARFEVVVVDDGALLSAEELRAAPGGIETTVVRQERAGPAAARNAGVREARGELYAFTDDDCAAAPGWLRALARAASRPGVGAAGGAVVNGLPENRYARASQAVTDIVYGYYAADPSDARFLASNNLAVTAGAFERAGGFDESFRTAEDRDVCDRLRGAGLRLMFVPGAEVVHFRPLGARGYVEQHFGYGRGATGFHRGRRERGTRSFPSDLRFYGDLPRLAGARLREASPADRPGLGALLGLWQAANAAGFLWESARVATGARRP